MAYETKRTLNTDKTYTLGKEGNPTSIEGYYLGNKAISGDYGTGVLHIFQTGEGNVGIWGKTNLNKLLTVEHTGQMCLVSFTGMGKPAKGRRPAYEYELKYDKNNTIDTSAVVTTSEDEQDDDLSESDLDSDEYSTATAFVPKVTPKSVAVTAETQARVKSLLNNRNKSV